MAVGSTILLAMPASVCALEANRAVFAHSWAFSHVLTRPDRDNKELLPFGFLASSTLKLCPPRIEWFTDKIASCASVGFGI